MEKLIQINYNIEDNYIYAQRNGDVHLHHVMSFIQTLDDDYSNFARLNIIDDFRNSITSFNERDYPVIIKEIFKRIYRYNRVKHAVIADKAFDVALMKLFEYSSKVLSVYECKVFKNLEDAREWILVN